MNELRIRVVAPAGPVRPERLRAGAAVLEGLGCRVSWTPAVEACWGHLAGSDAARAADLQAALLDPDVDAIWAARGGFGGLRLLPLLDVERLAARPAPTRPPLIGYSDLTSLQNALAARLDWPVWHAPMIASELAEPLDALSAASLAGLLAALRRAESPPVLVARQDSAGNWSLLESEAGLAGSSARLRLEGAGCVQVLGFHADFVWRKGEAAGRLAGGNLSVLGSLYGSGWEPDLHGRLLLLEDHGEYPFRLDRHLTQLANAAAFSNSAALLLGSFARCEEPDPDKSTFTATELLRAAAARCPGPVLAGLPFGHQAPRLSLPFHGQATLHT
ncbi:MAG: LD-carboxypeptidase [Candidatus Delongbacteria bacterium]